MLITYSEMAHMLLCAMIIIILATYNNHFVLLDASLYCMVISVIYCIYTILKCLLRYMTSPIQIKWSNLWILSSAIILIGCFIYFHTQHSINSYVGDSKFYIGQEGIYTVLIDSPIESTVIDDVEYKKCTVQMIGVQPLKETARHNHIQIQGSMNIIIKESDPLHMGDVIELQTTPIGEYDVEERGTIDKRSRHIREYITCHSFGGFYKKIPIETIYDYPISTFMLFKQKILSYIGISRQYIEHLMTGHLSDSTKWIGTSLLLGGHYGELGPDVLREFGYTGIIHILSISGSHIGLLFSIVYILGRIVRIKKRISIIVGVIVVILYSALVGASAPVIRSTLMGICMALGVIEGRLYSAKQGLAITAIIFLLYDPLLLLDVSFQLSFGATYGLLIFGMPIYRQITVLPPMVKAPLVLCLAAQLYMISFQLYYFHYISIMSMVAALIITPLLDLGIILLFIVTLIYSIVPIGLLWLVIDILLKIALSINHTLAQASPLLIWIGIMPMYCVVLYYILLGFLYVELVPLKAKYKIHIFCIACSLIGVLCISYTHITERNHTIVHIVPMKQSRTFIIARPYDKTASVYIDTPDGIPVHASEYKIINALHSFGLHNQHIDIKRFQSNGHSQILYENDIALIGVWNRQNDQKKLKLKDTKYKIYITNRSNIAYQFSDYPNLGIVATTSGGTLRDLDPDSTYIWGYTYIPDWKL